MELLRSRLRFIFPIDGERKKGPACSTTVIAYARARARACHSRRFAIFFSFPFPPFFLARACMHACIARIRARTLHFVLPAVPGRELSDMEMHLIRYFRPKMSNVIEGAAGERHDRKQISRYYSRC